MQLQGTYTYCEALLELKREALARILSWGSNIFVVVANFSIANSLRHLPWSQHLLEIFTSKLEVTVFLGRRVVYSLWRMNHTWWPRTFFGADHRKRRSVQPRTSQLLQAPSDWPPSSSPTTSCATSACMRHSVGKVLFKAAIFNFINSRRPHFLQLLIFQFSSYSFLSRTYCTPPRPSRRKQLNRHRKARSLTQSWLHRLRSL